MKSLPLCILVSLSACATGMSVQERHQHSGAAIKALQAGDFDTAAKLSEEVIKAQPKVAEAHLVQAVAHYRRTMHTFAAALFGATSMFMGNRGYGAILRRAIEDTEKELGVVDDGLKRATVPDVQLDLCLACWEYDWNHSGEVDNNDRSLFQVEVDAEGNAYPEGDPRRKPTFHFDVADIHWARAMVAFQRSVLNLALAFKFEDAIGDALVSGGRKVSLPLAPGDRIKTMRAQLLHGFEQADACRVAIMAETDDEREWLPNARQKDHPLPLPVDDKLLENWRLITEDLRRLVRGEDGIDVAQAAQAGDKTWKKPPGGFINIGHLFEHPSAINFSEDQVEHLDPQDPAATEAFLRQIFGDAYVPKMKASGLINHVERIKAEVDRGEESLERKLRYLLWLN